MKIFKSSQEIFSDPWFEKSPNIGTCLPVRESWKKQEPIQISDVFQWEQIYYLPGDLGIYAAWNPYDDFFIIVHDLFLKNSKGIEIFRDQWALINRARDLGIDLEKQEIWISDQAHFSKNKDISE